MTKRTVTIEIDDTIEIHNSADFAKWAGLFGIEVGQRGVRPKAALARAILDYDGEDLPTTIVDTEYFSAAMGEDKPREASAYGVELAKLRTKREADIAAIREQYEKDVTALREKYGKAAVKAAGTGDVIVAARTPMLELVDKDNPELGKQVQRTKPQGDKPGRVKFTPNARKVTVSREDVKRARELLGKRQGRPSAADTLAAAVVVGEWFPVELMSVEGWETVLLKDAKVTDVPVESTTDA